MNEATPRPPKLGTWLLRKIYDDDLFDDVAGDLQELYTDRLLARGRLIAALYYFKDVLLSLRNIDLKRKVTSRHRNGSGMFKNYFKITFRTIHRNQVYSGLNIIGLAIGMAAFLFILQYVAYEKSYDKFHLHHKDLYRITYSFNYFLNGVQTYRATVPPRVAPFMKEVMPEVKAFARAHPASGLVVSYQNVKIRQDRILGVDPDFLKIFSFPLIEGNIETALSQLRTIVISEHAAKQYFGDQPAMGKIVAVDGDERYLITGVFKDIPGPSHLKFDFLISYETVKWWSEGSAETSWWFDDYYGYVLLEPGTDIVSFNQKFNERFNRERGKINQAENSKQEFHLQPITDIHLNSKLDKEAEPEDQGDENTVFFLTIIAFFILLIAWINYINLSTARAMERAKEVGVRKTLGALPTQLIYQFMVESFIINLLALIIALMIVFFSIPYFNLLANAKLNLDFLLNQTFWLQVIIFLVLGSLMAGLYPAFVLSSYRPIAALKGKLSAYGSGLLLRRTLIIFQFIASAALISGTMVVYEQLNYMRTADLGFDKSEMMVIRGPGPREDELGSSYRHKNITFMNELLKYPEITAVTGGSTVPGKEIQNVIVTKRREDPVSMFKTIQAAWIGYDYFSTLGVRVLAGRSFRPEFKSDTAAVILNVSAVKALGFDSPQAAINQPVSVGVELVWPVIGVVDDFHQMSFKSEVKPIFFDLYTGYSSYYVVKFAGRNYQSVLAKVKSQYETFYPRAPFDYFFLDEFFNLQYHTEQKFSRVFTLFAAFAIIVSCLGLFGLSSFSSLQRTKEIGIRKVLGADVMNIVYLLSREFIGLVIVGNLIAWPIVYLIMNDWLSNFANRISIGFPVFLLSGVTVLLIAVVTLAYKTVSTARSNPIHALKCE